MENLRQIESSDFPQIVGIFKHKQPAGEFTWLLQSPGEDNHFRGFVISKSETIVGVIGYITCNFAFNSKVYPFTLPNSWRILDNYKGLNGVLLLKKIITTNNNIMTIGGSSEAKVLLPYFKLEKTLDIEYYIKVFSPLKYFKSLNKKLYARVWYFLSSFSIRHQLFNGNVSLKPYDFSNVTENFVSHPDIFQHQLSHDFIKWMNDCPVIESFTYNIYHNNSYVGPCVIYRKPLGDNLYRGRIIFLPYVSEYRKWLEIVTAAQNTAKKLNCISVDVLCSNNSFKKVLIKCGFKNFPRKNLPVSIKTKEDLPAIIRDQAHIQFSDGDIGYRNI
jgi:hypothetical protein